MSILGKHSSVGLAPGPNGNDFQSADRDLCSLILRGSGCSKSQNDCESSKCTKFSILEFDTLAPKVIILSIRE